MSITLKFGSSGENDNTQKNESPPTNEMKLVMKDSTFQELRDTIYKHSGIYFTDGKKYLLEGRISKRLTAKKLSSYEEYIALLKSAAAYDELPFLFEAVTINETYFFRAAHQFEAIEKIIFPEIIANKPDSFTKTFRIWSAASSTGEEAYTLAIITLEKLKPLYPNVQFQIIGSDINNAVLENAREGVFKEYAIRNVPPHLLRKYFQQNGNSYILNQEVKNLVKFVNINLYDPIQMRSMSGCDIIICANVLIYFDMHSKQQAVSQLYNALNPGGYLFIGYSESLHGVSKDFKLVHLPKAMAYKK